MSQLGLPTVPVAGIEVVDADEQAVLGALAAAARDRPVLAYALHVGGLNSAGEPAVRRAYAAGDLTYADGVAVVALARMAGATSIQRVPTTDLGPLLVRTQGQAGRGRVFLLGGPEGLADAAGRRIAADSGVTIVGAMSGMSVDRDAFLAAIREAEPDVVFVGMGAPREILFLSELRDRLPPALYLTCGGWFGFLVGTERRAPAVLRRYGLEWVWRLKHHPQRLLGRYSLGVWTTARLAARMLLTRTSF
jgi:N-acetylglucosaminyldiphosphoundecaprenol N-acetyl-beta-D-mannosaminyltransferase